MSFLQCSTTPRGARAEERRLHLLETARKLFIEHGFHGTGVAQIAAASGIKVGQIYRDFSSKDDIIVAIVERDLAIWLDEASLARAVAADDFVAVREWIAGFFSVDCCPEEDRLMPDILAEATRNRRIADLMTTVETQIRGSLLTAIRATVPGAARDEDCSALADLILTLGIGLSHRRLSDPARDVRRIAERLWQIVEREIEQVQPALAD